MVRCTVLRTVSADSVRRNPNWIVWWTPPLVGLEAKSLEKLDSGTSQYHESLTLVIMAAPCTQP
jgi:hypothetical protein